jgi:exopolysaccharide biosynthesis polyprenyl glycosylphosphotransferase
MLARGDGPHAAGRYAGRSRVTGEHVEVAGGSGHIDLPPAPAPSRLVAPAVPRQTRLRRGLLAADLLTGALTGAVAAFAAGLRAGRLPLPVLASALGSWVLAYLGGLYAVDDLRSWASGIAEAPRIAVGTLLASWPLFGLLFALDAPRPVRGALLGAIAWGCLTGLGRAAVRVGLHRAPALRQRVVIVGSGSVARSLVERMRSYPELGLDPVGFVDDEVQGSDGVGVQRLGGIDDLGDLIALGGVDRVIVAFTRARHERLLGSIRACRADGVTVGVVPRLFENLDGARYVDQVGGLPLLSIEPPSFTWLSRACKRGLDIALASLILFALLPLLLGIALAIQIESGRPVLFTQRRSGRGGRFFVLYKFRSMRTDSKVLVRPDGVIVKRPDDARVTRVGQWLRRFSLDEAPQLFNVLRGDMSLVGPRPLVREEYDSLVEDWQSRRADLRPGLTGPWQVSGRSRLPFEEMIRLDYEYVAGWSLARDLEILLATLPAVISGRGAY